MLFVENLKKQKNEKHKVENEWKMNANEIQKNCIFYTHTQKCAIVKYFLLTDQKENTNTFCQYRDNYEHRWRGGAYAQICNRFFN